MGYHIHSRRHLCNSESSSATGVDADLPGIVAGLTTQHSHDAVDCNGSPARAVGDAAADCAEDRPVPGVLACVGTGGTMHSLLIGDSPRSVAQRLPIGLHMPDKPASRRVPL